MRGRSGAYRFSRSPAFRDRQLLHATYGNDFSFRDVVCLIRHCEASRIPYLSRLFWVLTRHGGLLLFYCVLDAGDVSL